MRSLDMKIITISRAIAPLMASVVMPPITNKVNTLRPMREVIDRFIAPSLIVELNV